MEPFSPEPAYLTTLPDGTVKQVNPFTGTMVWTVAGRGNRPLGIAAPQPEPLDPDRAGSHCAFCEKRYLETPPEKSRMVRVGESWQQLDWVRAQDLFATTAEFRRIPNLFEILSYEYWHANYGYDLPPAIAQRRGAYLADPVGREHVLNVARTKLRAGGASAEKITSMTEEQVLDAASGFFGGGHDVIAARRHYVDGATDSTQLASSGTLSTDEHFHYIRFTIDAMKRLYSVNRYARFVAVFQNWLKPAGASFDHLHKQLVAIDERSPRIDATLPKLRANPNLFNEVATNYASYRNLLIAENDYALAFAGFGHRYPTIEVYSKAENSDPWEMSTPEIGGMSDLIHAMHAATGPEVPCNEEWHTRPVDVTTPMPWRVMLKWRVSTLAGFEGNTKIYLNTIDPVSLRDRVVPRLFELRARGAIADMRIATECSARPNQLRYCR